MGAVPQVSTALHLNDHLGTASVRIGYNRDGYKVVPGLYAIGDPTPDSPVLVTGNYKLTFDVVRKELQNQNLWLLVVDTRGINIWCAAGKNLFSTSEVVRSVRETKLERVVTHRELILPQLGATGVAAIEVRKNCGFKVTFGPVRAEDIPAFIKNDNTATRAMRTVTFPLRERVELIFVEFWNQAKLVMGAAIIGFILSGFGPGVYSLSNAWERGQIALVATLIGFFGGNTFVPILLNKLPFRSFWPKGALVGGVLGMLWGLISGQGLLGTLAIILWSGAGAAFTAMNFTGSTPYTSATGVEREMRLGMPIQAVATLAAVTCWVVSACITQGM